MATYLNGFESDRQQQTYASELKSHLSELIGELEKLDTSMRSAETPGRGELEPLESLEARLIQQNKEMLKTIKKLTADKAEMKAVIARLEEDIWNYKHKYKNEINSLTEHDREKVCARI